MMNAMHPKKRTRLPAAAGLFLVAALGVAAESQPQGSD